MKLKEYLSENGKTHRDFIEETYARTGHRFPIGTLEKYLVGHRIPRKREMRVIYAATDEKVTPNDFYLGELHE